MVFYKEGDFALLKIPKIDRSGTDSTHLPVKVEEIIKLGNGHMKYRLLTRYGILDTCYAADELKPSSVVVECEIEVSTKKVALSTAARSHNSRTTAVTTSCICKSTCLTKKCRCKLAGYACSSHCHAFYSKCLNKDINN